MKPRLVVGVVTALVLVLFCLRAASNMGWLGFAGFGRIEQIRLGAYEGDVGALEWIAQDRGFFNQVGLAVELKGYGSGKEAADALRAGRVDVATASEYVVASRSFTEADLRVLGSISYYRNKGIVARRDRAINAPGDLRGKRIGVTVPSGAEYSLYVFLALHGLGLQDVTIVNLPPLELRAAIQAGNIDAAITWQPHVGDLERLLGSAGVSFRGDGFDTYLLLITLQQSLDSQGAALKKLMHAMVLAQEWAQAHPDEAKHYVATRFKLEPDDVETLWPNMPLEVTLPQELLVAMDGEARWLARKGGGATSSIPDYTHFIHSDELKAVKPSAVTLFSEAKRTPSAGAAAAR